MAPHEAHTLKLVLKMTFSS